VGQGYFAASSGNVTDEVILQYIATQGQEPSESDEDFKIEELVSSGLQPSLDGKEPTAF
jgi:hypothetical protein